MINIGKYIETAINWLTNHFATFFDTLSIGIGGFIDSFQHVLYGIPFYITIIALTVLAWIKSGKGTAVFTILGLLLIYGMGFWEETMQTLALVLSSTCLALLLGVPLGIWTANSNRCNKIMRPILDFMQTMPAFVYLIPAVLFFGLGTVPGAFATVINHFAKRTKKLIAFRRCVFGRIVPVADGYSTCADESRFYAG